jgi:hypothetical protein
MNPLFVGHPTETHHYSLCCSGLSRETIFVVFSAISDDLLLSAGAERASSEGRTEKVKLGHPREEQT